MSRARVMIVEDEAVVQVHLRRLVTSLGHEVVGVATSARQALSLAANARPEVALIDVNIEGEVDGITA
ncbi:MAG: response regulator, partial [Candidatus Krumholzibacteria bacterium]|nr:response regulator [Candidatus Krumholzibacteria bacterium]